MHDFGKFRQNMKHPLNLKHFWPKQLICLSVRILPPILFHSPLCIKLIYLLINRVGWVVTKCGWRLFASHGRFRLGWAVTIKLKYWVGWTLTNDRLRFGWAVTINPKYWVVVGCAVTKFPRHGQVRLGCNNLIKAKKGKCQLGLGSEGAISHKNNDCLHIFQSYSLLVIPMNHAWDSK